ncbi:hypothetical protein BYT27DRAFT_7208897 [Phlegmacium glaucopus]|nr:hypothetical protein BYT27DRAFT_7208897 [Phlegmacium glaucopus]
MSTSHKRNHSIIDSPMDLTDMQLAHWQQRLGVLREELSGIKEAIEEMEQAHVDALCPASKKLKLTFSTVDKEALMNMGISHKALVINREMLQKNHTVKFTNSIKLLCAQINCIHQFVSMRFEPAARMLIDAVLLSVAELSADGDIKTPVAIFPEMRVATGDGVKIVNPDTNFEVWLTGSADYVLCTFADESLRTQVLQAELDDVMKFGLNCTMLVEGKKHDDHLIYDNMPEAISQAAALCEATGISAIRFILSDGWNWVFSLLTKDSQGYQTCYGGQVFHITEPRPGLESSFQQDVHIIVQLVHHWYLVSAQLVAKENPLQDQWYELTDP